VENNKTRSKPMFALGVAILVGAFLLLILSAGHPPAEGLALNAGGRASTLDQLPPSQGPTSTAPGPTDATLTDRLRQETGAGYASLITPRLAKPASSAPTWSILFPSRLTLLRNPHRKMWRDGFWTPMANSSA